MTVRGLAWEHPEHAYQPPYPSAAEPQRLTQEQRRLRAGELFAQGRSQAEVAQQLGVSRQSAKRWHDRWRAGGAQALRSRGRSGRPPRVPDDQLE